MENKSIKKIFNELSATDQPDLMSEAEYAFAFDTMRQALLSQYTPVARPTLHYVTGLPGAGKSTVVGLMERENTLIVNFDDLRVYHPRYADHVKNDPVNAAARIDIAIERLIGWLCQEAAAEKINVILDDAAMGKEITKAILLPFEAAGYDIRATIVAVPASTARGSVMKRFEQDLAAAKKGEPVLPRWVNTNEQHAAPVALIETARFLEMQKIPVDVVDRQGKGLGAVSISELIEAITTQKDTLKPGFMGRK